MCTPSVLMGLTKQGVVNCVGAKWKGQAGVWERKCLGRWVSSPTSSAVKRWVWEPSKAHPTATTHLTAVKHVGGGTPRNCKRVNKHGYQISKDPFSGYYIFYFWFSIELWPIFYCWPVTRISGRIGFLTCILSDDYKYYSSLVIQDVKLILYWDRVSWQFHSMYNFNFKGQKLTNCKLVTLFLLALVCSYG